MWNEDLERLYQGVKQRNAARPQTPSSSGQNESVVGDTFTDLKIGVARAPGALTALADIPFNLAGANSPISRSADALGNLTGFKPGEYAKAQQSEFSPLRRQSDARVNEAFGRFKDTWAEGNYGQALVSAVGDIASEPRAAFGMAVQSIPEMYVGGALGRGIKATGALGAVPQKFQGAVAGGLGEGAIMAGHMNKTLNEAGVDPQEAALYALGTGAIGGAIGVGGGLLAQKMGLIDADTLFTTGSRALLDAGQTPLSMPRRIAGGAVSEGLLEEFPQEFMETTMENLATDRPVFEGAAFRGLQGAYSGAMMGGAMNIPGARRPVDVTSNAEANTDLLGDAVAPEMERVENTLLDVDALREEYSSLVSQAREFSKAAADLDVAERNKEYLSQVTGRMGEIRSQLMERGVPVEALNLDRAAKRVAKLDKDIAAATAAYEKALVDSPDKVPALVDKIDALNRVRDSLAAVVYPSDGQQLELFSDAPEQVAATPQDNWPRKKDGSLRDYAQKAYDAYDSMSDTEIARAIPELQNSTGAQWRVSMLETILNERKGGTNAEAVEVDTQGAEGQGSLDFGSLGVSEVGGRSEPDSGGSAEGAGGRGLASEPLGSNTIQPPTDLTQGAQNAQETPDAAQAIEESTNPAQEQPVQEGAVSTTESPRAFPARPVEDTPEARAGYINAVRDYFTAFTESLPKKDIDAARAVISSFREKQDVAVVLMRAREKMVQDATIDGQAPDAKALRDIDKRIANLQKQLAENETDPVRTALRAAAPELGVSHVTVRSRMNAALAAIGAEAEARGLDAEAVLQMLGLRQDSVAMFLDSISEAEAAQMGLSYRRNGPRVAANRPDDFDINDQGSDFFDGPQEAVSDEMDGQKPPRNAAPVADQGAWVDDAGSEVSEDAALDLDQVAAPTAQTQDTFATERDHRGLPLREVDFQEAAEDYNTFRDPEDAPFEQLPRVLQVQFTKAYVAHADEALSAREYTRIFGAIADETAKQPVEQSSAPERTAQETGAVEEGQTDVGGPVQRADGPTEPTTPTNPLEARVEALRALDLGPKQRQRLDALVERFQGDKAGDVGWLADELTQFEQRAFPESAGGLGMRYSKLADALEQWKTVVQGLISGEVDGTRPQTMFDSTPASMQVLGFPDLPVLAKMHMLKYLNQRFTQAQLENIPNEVADPVAVLMHEETDGSLSFNFVTRETNGNGFITVAVQPNTNDPRGGLANYTATVLNTPQKTILRELQEGRAAYVGDLSVVPGAPAAFQQGKRESGKDAVKFRESISRKFRLPTALKKVAFKSDLVKLVEGGQAKFSQNTPGTSRSSTDAVWDAIGRVLTETARRRIVVVQSADVLVEQGVLSSEEARGTQAFVTAEKRDARGKLISPAKAYFVADNIPAGNELAVFLHEVGAHLGIENILSDAQYKNLVQTIFKWAKRNDGSKESQIAQAALARVDAANLTNDADVAPETIAYFIEEAVKAGVNPTALNYNSEIGRWFRTLWAAFKTALRKLNLVNADQLTAQHVVDLAYGAARLEMSSTYHGTAAQFRQFNHDFMNSGEGAQAFGWGTYLAQRPGIAKNYWRQDVQRKSDIKDSWTYDGEVIDPDTTKLSEMAKLLTAAYGAGYVGNRSADAAASMFSLVPEDAATVAELAKKLDVSKAGLRSVREKPEGSFMHVDVNFTEDEMLDWDAPINEQSQEVLDALEAAGVQTDYGAYTDAVSGRTVYEELTDKLGSDKAASEFLDSIGVKGIKFLDQPSRGSRTNGRSKMFIDGVEYIPSMDRPWYERDATTRLMYYGGNVRAALEEAVDFDKVEEAQYLQGLLDRGAVVTMQSPNPTRNLVVFNDKNIFRIGARVGGPDAPLRFSRAFNDNPTPQGLFDALREKASNVDAFVNTVGHLRAFRNKSLTLEQLAEVAAVPEVDAYRRVMVAMQADSKKRINTASKIDVEWAKLYDKDSWFGFGKKAEQSQANNLSEVMRGATREQFDPEKGERPSTPEQQRIADLWERLSPEAQNIYREVRAFYEDSFNERKQILLDAAKQAKRAGANTREVERMFAKMKGPYFPLMRLGGYYSVGMSSTLAELVAKQEAGTATAAELKRIGLLRKDKKHYVTSGHQTRAEAKRASDLYKKDMGYGHFNEAEKRIASEMAKLPDVAAIEAHINADLPAGMRSHVKDMLVQMYFDMLPARHALKQSMEREGVHGEEPNMRRVFAASSMSQAHHISRMKHATELSEKLTAVKLAGRTDDKLRNVYNTLIDHSALALEQDQGGRFTNALMQVSYLANLGLSPAFLLTNLTQVPMITMPWLAARFGMGASTRAMWTSMADVSKMMQNTYGQGKFLKGGWRGEFDWSSMFPEDSGVARMFTEMLNRNLLDITMEHDLGVVAEMRSGAVDNFLKVINTPVRLTEIANRALTSLTAYRLSLAKDGDHDRAVEVAAQALSKTQLDYSYLNAPYFMKSVFGSKAAARIMMQFRKFQQGMLYLTIKTSIDGIAASGKDAAETARLRSEARKTLGGMFVTTGLMAGVLGMPLMSTVMAVMSGLGGDDDEPFDAKTAFRNYLTDTLGKDYADAIAKGLPHLFGVDMGRVGLDGLLNPVPIVQRADGAKQQASNYFAAAVGGAPMSTLFNVYEGLGMVASGDVAKGAEKVIPLKAVQNLMRAVRYEDEGLTDRNGNVVLPSEKFDMADLVLRGMGFQTTKEENYYSANAAIQGAKDHITKRRTRLLNEYVQAQLSGEPLDDVERRIEAFNEANPERGVRIDRATKLRSLNARKRMVSERNDVGLRVNKQNEPFQQYGRFATG